MTVNIFKLLYRRINKKMVPVKAFGSFLNMGVMSIFPYVTLQMSNIGLSIEDISYVYGAIPLFTFMTSPIAGYIGDKIGYNTVLVVNLILAGVSATAFDFTPRYKECFQIPTMQIGRDSNNHSTVNEFVWPLACNITNVTIASCQEDPILTDLNFWSSLNELVFCNNEEANLTVLHRPPSFSIFDVLTNSNNGSMCQAKISNETNAETVNTYQVCNYTSGEESLFQQCYISEGSHSVTFWVYFGLRMLFQMSMIACYTSFDGTALRQSKEFGSDYSWVVLYGTIASAVGPLISSLLVVDSEEGSDEENNYRAAYYFYDACLFMALLVSLKLKVTVGGGPKETDIAKKRQQKKENRKSLKQLISGPALIFFGIIFHGGLLWGVHDTYVAVYLTEYLGASSQLIAYTSALSTASGLLILPFAKHVVEKVGHIHIIFAGIICECGRLLVFSFVQQSPPNYAYGLALLDILVSTLYWISAMKYSLEIAPPTLVGTMAALAGSINWIIAKGLSSFLAGQIATIYDLQLPEIFQLTAAISAAGSIVFYIAYVFIGRNMEVKQISHVQAKRKAMDADNKKAESILTEAYALTHF